MITLLLIAYLKNNKEQALQLYRFFKRNINLHARILLLLLSAMLCSKMLFAQTLQYDFDIRKSNRCIGNIKITHVREGSSSSIVLLSDIKYRMLLLFKVSARETANFRDGILTNASIYRVQSGSKTIHQILRRVDNNYMLSCDESNEQPFNTALINFNILCMYISEPINIRQVFVDKLQKTVPLKKIAANHYRIEFPDGNYNDYFYTNGHCKRVAVHQGFFDIEIISTSIKQLSIVQQ